MNHEAEEVMFIPPAGLKLGADAALLRKWDRLIFVTGCLAVGLPILLVLSLVIVAFTR